MIQIENAGWRIASTNFWESELASLGFFYLTWQDGVGRLLMPRKAQDSIPDILSAAMVVISIGEWDRCPGATSTEILFEDDSDTPFAIHMLANMTFPMLTLADVGRTAPFTVWIEDGLFCELPAAIRWAPHLPWRKRLV